LFGLVVVSNVERVQICDFCQGGLGNNGVKFLYAEQEALKNREGEASRNVQATVKKLILRMKKSPR
jgi:hypothetical protein